MFLKEEVVFEDNIDFDVVDGKYNKKYCGKVVYDQSVDSIYIFSLDGGCYTAICQAFDLMGEKFFSPKELIIDEVGDAIKVQELQGIVSVDDLIRLQNSFDVDGILKLRENGLI